MNECQREMENLDITGEHDGTNSDSDTTIGPSPRRSSARSNPFDMELPDDFAPRSLEWFMNPRPDPKKPLSMFWTDPVGYYAAPTASRSSPENEEQSKQDDGKLGTMGSLDQWFLPRKRDKTEIPKWTVGAPLFELPFRRVSITASDISRFQIARPPTPPRKRSPDTMSNKPLPPLPRARRFVSEGHAPLLTHPRSPGVPAEFTLSRWSDSSESDTTQEVPATTESVDTHEAPQELEQATSTMNGASTNGEPAGGNILANGPHLLVRIHHYLDRRMTAINQMETTLSNPHIPQALRKRFIAWSQQLIDLDYPFLTNPPTRHLEQVKIYEKDAHRVVDWAIEVGTMVNVIQDQLNQFMDAADLVAGELREMTARLDMDNGSLLPAEELYHKMTDIVRRKCRSPHLHEALLLRSFLNLYDNLMYNPFQIIKDQVVVVHDEYPHDPVTIPLNIETPLSLLKRVLDAVYVSHGEYTELTRRIRQEFFVPIEERIPGVASRTEGYLNNVIGPSNVI
ncbi:hypothetical protein TSTA_049700 [Talaromyces stipitatus ATCC 10500]|uniref:Uncharacterized protein n=1 Tax=Talaromyces stipitatus (strain ATCC 10500 / CBS 375.48 / QM 6759 / NRRL 1006) TaxID=441959 RepID=B8MLJ9_TALSN|nr:uncharacterized protein TSTA_049700 [Talaromyces stipitatus ATCC 10500]EED15532.1 hypothetical protein TSTA_049700 [Talaromyces stipitatus ATCC 10500]